MKVRGVATLHAPVDRVWAALNDPAVLVRTIPGCEQLEEIGPERYRMTVTAGVASIKGSYTGEVALTDRQHPSSFVLKASGSGAPGTVTADVLVSLAGAGDGTTELTYDADAVVGGPVGGVGQRVLTGVAKKTAGEFFKAVDGVLTGTAPAPAPASPARPQSPLSGTDPAGLASPEPAVFRPPPAPPSVGGEFPALLKAALAGAAIALLGVLVGSVVARRR